ncbi:hypothetical protein BGZ76_008139 [Entomortierella beljakovae]|nr:hypothetical protein BGZ76_008139 [Entomortierella beljakovae]
MAKPNFETAIGGIATKLGAIPVQRPQDAIKTDSASLVTIAQDGNSITGESIGKELNVGDTVYIECGSFEDSERDSRVTQCYGVVSSIISDNHVAVKYPGIRWIPVTLTSERDIEYIKSRKIVKHGSLKIRVERGNTWVGINNALIEQERMNNGGLASSATETINKFVQKIFSKSPEPEYHRDLENGTFRGTNVPGSLSAPPNFHTSESTPLLAKTRSIPSSTQNAYSTIKRTDSNYKGISDSTTQSSSIVGLDDDQSHRNTNGYSTEQTAPRTEATQDSGSSSGSNDSNASIATIRFPTTPCSFQYSRPIDHKDIYDSVWKNFENQRTVAVFPEGVSSDDYHLLDFKYGCTIMVLGYLSQSQTNTLRIVPCGLNFFNRHRFRSHFYADYGRPLTVPNNLVQMYKEGGDAKKQACTELLNLIHDAVERLTLNAPNYDELRLYKATRRLYSTGEKLSVPQKLELTRRFAKGYANMEVTQSIAAFKRDVNEYDRNLTNKGVRDWQLTANPSILTALFFTLPCLFLLPPLFLISLPGTLLFGPAGLLASTAANYKGRQAMLAFQSYLPVSRWPGRDVIATWKIIVSLALMPVCFILYATILTITVAHHEMTAEYWTMGRLVAFWLLSACVIFPGIAYGTVSIWEWQIDLKMQIQVWWWKITGENSEMKKWRNDLCGRMDELVNLMGGKSVFDVSGYR